MTDPLDAPCDHPALYVVASTMRTNAVRPCLFCERDSLRAELERARQDIRESDTYHELLAERDSLLERNNRLLRDNGALIADVAAKAAEIEALSSRMAESIANREHAERLRP